VASLAAGPGGDYRAAFARYEHLLRGYVARGQKQALGGRDFLAPAAVWKRRHSSAWLAASLSPLCA
jgi:hypothetical protein